MSKIELTYFDGAGRALATRLCFIYGGIEFKDTRVSKDEWPALKAAQPIEQLPVLTIDGVAFSESSSHHRYAAKKAGLTSDNINTNLLIDEAIFICEDIVPGFAFAADKAQWNETRGPVLFKRLNELFAQIEAQHEKPFSLAHFYIYAAICSVRNTQFFPGFKGEFFTENANVLAAIKKVADEPKFAAYFEQHAANEKITL